MAKRLVVIGGGISGTAAAFTAQKTAAALGQGLDVRLLERDTELGGKAQSRRRDGWLFETGPIGYLSAEPVVDELVRDAGLESALLVADEAQFHRFVFSGNRVREVKAHPVGFATSGLLSLRGLLRAAWEPFIPAKRDESDESVWDFAARRLGPEFASRLIHPMVLGIFAGDARRLSLRAAFPRMAELEREHGSLVRAQVARARQKWRGERPSSRATLRSFREGIQTLPRALASKGRFAVATRTAVRALLASEDGGYRVVIANENEALRADAVIVACEGYRAAELLGECLPEVSRMLLEVHYPPVYVVALGYEREARRRIPRGFGVLIPRDQGFRALGATCDGYLFPGRGDSHRLLVRVLFGGRFDPDIAEIDAEEVIATAKDEIAALFGLEMRPVFADAKLWERAIPQYELGHLDRVRRIEAELRGRPGLHLAGNALHGTAFGKAATRGVLCGKQAAEALFRSDSGR